MNSWHDIALEGVRKLEEGDARLAQTLLEQAIELNPKEAWPFIKLAELKPRMEDRIALYERSLAVEVTDWAFIGLIRTYLREDMPYQAYLRFRFARSKLSDLSRILEVCPRIQEIASVIEDPSFNWQEFIRQRPHLQLSKGNKRDIAILHFLNFRNAQDPFESHPESPRSVPKAFNSELYKRLNPSTSGMDDFDVFSHFLRNNLGDGPIYSIDGLPADFAPEVYRMLNPDLSSFSDKDATVHFIRHGKKEKRLYNSGIRKEEMLALVDIDTSKYRSYRNNCIVLVNHDSSLTGAPLFLKALGRYLSIHRVFRNIVFIDSYPTPSFAEIADRQLMVWLYHANNPMRLLDILTGLNPILIYSNSLNIFLSSVEKFEFFRYRTIFHLHEFLCDLTHFKSPRAIGSSRLYLVSEQIRSEYAEAGCLNSSVFPPFIDAESLSAIDQKAKEETPVPVQSAAITIGMCGTISERKNFMLFLALARALPELHFLWVGATNDQIKNYSANNLQLIPFTQNPYSYFQRMDYFFLTSQRDPCPIVVLEALYLNKKVIVLDGNISYRHPDEELENYIVIKDHANSPDKIASALTQLPLTKRPNLTLKNRRYVRKQFSRPRILQKRQKWPRDVISLSYFVSSSHEDEQLVYYSNLINQFILRQDERPDVVIQISSDTRVPNATKSFFKSNIIENPRVYERPNRGFDIGGLLDTIALTLDEHPEHQGHLIYLHSKSDPVWREQLHRIMYCDSYKDYDLVASERFFVSCETSDLNRHTFYKHPFFSEIAAPNNTFNYVAGTTFITKFDSLLPLYKNRLEIAAQLTDVSKDDPYWREIMLDDRTFNDYVHRHKSSSFLSPIDPDSQEYVRKHNCRNYLDLAKRFKRRGIPDCHFEHALERYIGFLVSKEKKTLLV